jgi:urease accessory protein
MSFFSPVPDIPHDTPNLRLVFKKEGEKTVLAESFSRMPFCAFPPFYSDDGGCAYTYVVNPTPGYLAGDRVEIDILLQPHAHAFITAPSATRILKTGPNRAEQTTHIHVADGAILEYIPSYVIPFAGSRFRQRTTIHMEEGSTCLSLDWFSTGRISRGENLAFEEYDNSTMVICKGKPIVFDRFVLRPQDEDYSALGRMESYTVSALLCLVHGGPGLSKSFLEGMRDLFQDKAAVGGLSALSASALTARILGANIPSVQKPLFQLIGFIRKNLLGIVDNSFLYRVVRLL